METVRSFDVFDTVVTRHVGAPTALVDLLAKGLARDGSIPVPAPVFAAARLRYERQLTANLQRHATLHEIYPADAEAWAEAEERLECELVLPLPGAMEMLASARSDSDAVVFVSDTPHTE